jgi:hypothetical protein
VFVVDVDPKKGFISGASVLKAGQDLEVDRDGSTRVRPGTKQRGRKAV